MLFINENPQRIILNNNTIEIPGKIAPKLFEIVGGTDSGNFIVILYFTKIKYSFEAIKPIIIAENNPLAPK